MLEMKAINHYIIIDLIKESPKKQNGLIIADTYGIPNAWLSSKTPKGGEFKFFDYFLSVDKVRYGQTYDVKRLGLDVSVLHEHFDFDGRPIKFDAVALLRACPFLKEVK